MTKQNRTLIAFILLTIVVVAAIVAIGAHHLRPNQSSCGGIASIANLSIPCAFVERHASTGRVYVSTEALDLEGNIVSEYSRVWFRLWYFLQPHPSLGATLYERLGLSKEMLASLALEPGVRQSRTVKAVDSADIYQLEFERNENEWRIRTLLDSSGKPANAEQYADAIVQTIIVVFDRDQPGHVDFLVSCLDLFQRGGERTSTGTIEPTGGCSIDMPRPSYYMQATFSGSAAVHYRRVIEMSDQLSKRWQKKLG